MPKVSVNIPVYNGEKTVERAVRSVLALTYPDFEVVVVDDGSTDGTARVLDSLAEPRLKVVRHAANRGISASRNSALRASSGEYIVVLDADDVALPGRIRRQARALDEDPSLDGVFGWCELFTESPDEVVSCFSPRVDPAALREMILLQNPFYHSSACLRRRALGEGYREDLECAEDYAKWLELIFNGAKLAVLRQPLIKYWVHHSTHYTWERMRRNIKRLQTDYFEKAFGRRLTDDQGETHLALYGLPERMPAERAQALELLSRVEQWTFELGAMKPVDPAFKTARMLQHARDQLYLLLWHLAPVAGLGGISRFVSHYPARRRVKLLVKSQLPATPHAARSQMAPEEDVTALKLAKRATLGLLDSAGVSKAVAGSGWRRRRLLILCYHSLSVADEHLWHGAQFMRPEVFRSRLQLLRENRCEVLPLAEGVERLYAGTLPERAVAITFDDGTLDFHTKALPVIREFGFPVTLYLTTFYTHFNRPVWTLMASYLLWKSRHRALDLGALLGQGGMAELHTERQREAAMRRLGEHVKEARLQAEDKDELLRRLAEQLEVEYEPLLKQRFLHNVSDDEARDLAAAGVDLQLHTHRHRTPLDRALFLREIEDNRQSIRRLTGRRADHFCYPSGVTNPLYLPWLREAGVASGTTCVSGLASRRTERLLLPRLLDTSTLSGVEFSAWLHGVSAALPKRSQARELPAV